VGSEFALGERDVRCDLALREFPIGREPILVGAPLRPGRDAGTNKHSEQAGERGGKNG